MLLQEDMPLAPLTTFRIGGCARFLVEARSSADVGEAVAFARSRNLPLFVLGGGSNLVMADAGWPGLVLRVAIAGVEKRSGFEEGKALFEAGAGEKWDEFVAQTVGLNCAGIECLSGIPGSVGDDQVAASAQHQQRKIARVCERDCFLDIRRRFRFHQKSRRPSNAEGGERREWNIFLN